MPLRLDEGESSGIIAVFREVGARLAAGEDIVDLSLGEPALETPEHVKEAAIAAIRRGETRYTQVNGTPALRGAIQTKFRRDNGLDYAPEEIAIGAGAKQVIFNAMAVSLEPGDEVILPVPCWSSYPAIVRLAGGVPRFAPCDAGSAFALDPTAVEAALGPRTRWLVLNSPSNPSGAVYERAAIEAVAVVLERYPAVRILSDDVYEHLVYDGARMLSAAQVGALTPRTLTVNAVSKAYAMTGWRLGFAGGPRKLIERMNRLQSESTSHPSSISQAAARAALEGDQSFLAEWAAHYRERRDRALELLAEVPGLECQRPRGAFFLFIGCAGLLGARTPRGTRIESDIDIARHLLHEAGVALVPGSAFAFEPYLRLSYATSLAALTEGCARIRRGCAALGI